MQIPERAGYHEQNNATRTCLSEPGIFYGLSFMVDIPRTFPRHHFVRPEFRKKSTHL